MTFLTIKNKALNLISSECLGERIYLIAYMFLVGEMVFETTMFTIPPILDTGVKLCLISFVGFKISFLDRYKPMELISAFLILGLSLFVFIKAYFLAPFYWALLLVGAKDVSFAKILRTHLVVAGSAVFTGMMGCLFEIIENLKYSDIKAPLGIRYSFGNSYTTDFTAYIFCFCLIAMCIFRDRVKLKHLLYAFFGVFVMYYYTGGKLDSLTILMSILLYGGYLAYRNRKDSFMTRGYRQPVLYKLSMAAMPFAAVFSTVVALAFGNKIDVQWDAMHATLLHRVSLSYNGFRDFGITLFGKHIELVGAGYNPEGTKGAYNFVDCSFHYVLFQYGLIMMLLVIAIYMINCYRMKYDYYYLIAILVLAVNCIVSHHIIEVAYNPFSFALFAKCSEKRHI